LIVESIEQGSSSKGKKVVESDNYDDYIKLKNENKKLKKDLEKASTTNTVVNENLDNDHDMALKNKMLREENKRRKMEMSLKKQTTNESLIEENKKLKLEKEHLKRAQNEFDVKIKKIRSDSGKEFVNTNIEEYCDEVGIKHEVSVTYTPQQNGVVERKNMTLITLARTMLDEYNTPQDLWAEAINTACYASNRLFLQKFLNKTSYELLNGRHLILSGVRLQMLHLQEAVIPREVPKTL
jgi:galactitol-specific phosphotransferase system IIB component